MKIGGLAKTTLIDYPGLVAATIFTVGCNFCCPFCHNRDLVLPSDHGSGTLIGEDEVFAFLEKRKNVLGGICISGGEPTLQADLPDFIRRVKGLGLKVKLDTNGAHPEVLAYLLTESLLDYIAMDIKNSKEKYAATCGLGSGGDMIKKIEASVALVAGSGLAHEFRTTVVRELHDLDDLTAIGGWLPDGALWYLQSYKDSENVICPGFSAYSGDELTKHAAVLRGRGVSGVRVR